MSAQLQDGSAFTGVFHATVLEEGKPWSVILKAAQKLSSSFRFGAPGSGQLHESDNGARNTNPLVEQLIVKGSELVQMRAVEVVLGGEAEKRRGFQTDTQISGRDGIVERELTKWSGDVSKTLLFARFSSILDLCCHRFDLDVVACRVPVRA